MTDSPDDDEALLGEVEDRAIGADDRGAENLVEDDPVDRERQRGGAGGCDQRGAVAPQPDVFGALRPCEAGLEERRAQPYRDGKGGEGVGCRDRKEEGARPSAQPEHHAPEEQRPEAAQEAAEGDGADGELRTADLGRGVVSREADHQRAGGQRQIGLDEAEGDAAADDQGTGRQRRDDHQDGGGGDRQSTLARLLAEMRVEEPLGREAEGDEREGEADQIVAEDGISRDPHEENDRGGIEERGQDLRGQVDRGEKVLHVRVPCPRVVRRRARTFAYEDSLEGLRP